MEYPENLPFIYLEKVRGLALLSSSNSTPLRGIFAESIVTPQRRSFNFSFAPNKALTVQIDGLPSSTLREGI